jgi:DNA-binding NtrC family response regulator
MTAQRLVIVEPEGSLAADVRARLVGAGYPALEAGKGNPTLRVVVAAPAQERRALELVRRARLRGDGPVLLVAARSSEDLVIAALRAGVSDYLAWPAAPADLAAAIHRCLAARAPRGGPPPAPGVPRLIGESRAMRDVRAYLTRVAASDANVLISGETGTGKELAAETIHAGSRRAARPFVPINCAALPEGLLESELFGHERGAFTGAHAAREGKLKLADGGTVFFDEIGDMSLTAQAKILRAIESRTVHRLGGPAAGAPLDVRIISATHRDLDRAVADGAFRQDLYYRLDVARVHLPPLRERAADLPTLVAHYVAEFNRRLGLSVAGLTEEALDAFLAYDWPGNVRELRNLVEAAFVNLPRERISLDDLPEPLRRRLGAGARPRPQEERDQLLSALVATRWNKSRAAARLNWSRMTLYRKLAKYRISRGDARPDVADAPHPDTPRL